MLLNVIQLFLPKSKAVQVAIGEVRGFLYPTAAERSAAYELMIELSTRSTTVSAGSAGGSIRESLDSLHAMFGLTREILRRHGVDASKGSGGNLSLAAIAVRVLNDVFRPLLSTWHPVLRAYEEARPEAVRSAMDWERQWALAGRCREDLADMRVLVRAYLDTLGRIAGASNLADALTSPPPSMVFSQTSLSSVPAHPLDLKPRAKMVRWLRLSEMWRAGPASLAARRSWKAMLGAGAHADVQPVAVFDAKKNEEFWFDYIADTGDAFDGTAPVAWLMGRQQISLPADRSGELPPAPAALPRGELLVFGGDEVYPFAKAGVYESQTELPFRMGLEQPHPDDVGLAQQAAVVAIPGNHDWLGGVEHFMKLFGAGRMFADHWRTVQDQSWWHVKLPQGWWLWGIDTGLHNVMPQVQIDSFAKAAERLYPGDRVILCTPVPLWQLRQKHPQSYVQIRSAIDPLVLARGASIPLCLSGDSHYFAHFESADPDVEEDHITAGGGGAFLHPTHGIPERIPLEAGNAEFRLTSRWPLPADSRALAPLTSNLRDRQYWLIVALFGALHAAFMWLAGRALWRFPWSVAHQPFGDGASSLEQQAKGALRWSVGSPLAVLMLVLFTLAGVLAVTANSREPRVTKAARVYGLAVGGLVATSLVAVSVARRLINPSAGPVVTIVGASIGGAVSTMLLFSLLTWVNGRIKAVDNLVFSAAHLTRFKHFLRFRIDCQGDLTCYVVGIDPVGKGWYQAMTQHLVVPPFDPAGIPRVHYVWGKTYRKFVPEQIRIAVSVSGDKDSEELKSMVETLATAFAEGGHSLLYGGRPKSGFTAQLNELAQLRHADNPNAPDHVLMYVANYLWDREWSGRVHDDEFGHYIRVTRFPEPGETTELQVIRDLTEMRRTVTRHMNLRVVVAGSLTPEVPGTRLAPGVLEEAYLAVLAGKPLVVIGGFGGAAKLIADALLGRLDQGEVARLASDFVDLSTDPRDSPAVGFTAMLGQFSSLSVLRNGLTDAQNRELLETRHQPTVSALVATAVRRIAPYRTG